MRCGMVEEERIVAWYRHTRERESERFMARIRARLRSDGQSECAFHGLERVASDGALGKKPPASDFHVPLARTRGSRQS